MKVLVDTSVWSLAFRKKLSTEQDNRIVQKLSELIDAGQVVIIGSIRQEILSGIRDVETFEKLRVIMTAFPDTAVLRSDYEQAARFLNQCRAKDIQGSHTDFLMVAVCYRLNLSLFTLDKDFNNFTKVIPIALL